MFNFKYVAKDRSGKVISGTHKAESQADVLSMLSEKGFIPVSITKIAIKKDSTSFYEKLNEQFLSMQSSVAYKDIVFFTRQMATFMNAGVPLVKSIKNIAESQKNIIFKRILNEIADDLITGAEYSAALAKHKSAFDQMYVNIVRAGEASGSMEEALFSLANYMERTAKMKQAIKSAMMYPKFVAIFTALMVFIILWQVIPIFQQLYSGMGAELPLPTQILVNSSNFVQTQFYLIIGSIIGFFILKKYIFKIDAVSKAWDKLVISFPVFGEMVRQIIISRITSTLALLMKTGTSMLQSLEIAGKVASNYVYEVALNKTQTDVKNGVELSAAMRSTQRFDDIVIQLVETGEETGRMDELMQKIADFYDEEVNVKIKGFSSLIEPFLILMMGVVIGGIVVGIYLPIITMGEVITG